MVHVPISAAKQKLSFSSLQVAETWEQEAQAHTQRESAKAETVLGLKVVNSASTSASASNSASSNGVVIADGDDRSRFTSPSPEPEPTSFQRKLARLTWWCEYIVVLLTWFYVALVFHDLSTTTDETRLTSPSWFNQGFCVDSYGPWNGQYVGSHTLCFFGDVIGGGMLLAANCWRYHKLPHPSLKLAIAVSFFSIMHGAGHLAIGEFLPLLFLEIARPEKLLNNPMILFAYACMLWVFLGIGPFIGHMNGVNYRVCSIIHIVTVYAFMAYVPTQLAFGAIQLLINFWYCLPRILNLGYDSAEDVGARVEGGWACASVGLLFIMPVVFIEAFACDDFLKFVGGHFIYDVAILLFAAVYSYVLWQIDESRISLGKKN